MRPIVPRIELITLRDVGGDDLLRKGIESARMAAEHARGLEKGDRAHLERRISEFVQALDTCLRLMDEHGNPGLEPSARKGGVSTRSEERSAWRLESPDESPSVRALTPSGEFALLRGGVRGWYTAADYIRAEVEDDHQRRLREWAELNKRRSVNFIGELPHNGGGGWRHSVEPRNREMRHLSRGTPVQHGIDLT